MQREEEERTRLATIQFSIDIPRITGSRTYTFLPVSL